MAARHRKCKTPDKSRFESLGDALTQARRLPFIVRPYKCRDHFHLTSNTKRKSGR